MDDLNYRNSTTDLVVGGGDGGVSLCHHIDHLQK